MGFETVFLKEIKAADYPALNLLFFYIFLYATTEQEKSYKSCSWEKNTHKKIYGKIHFSGNIMSQCPQWTGSRAP